MAMQQWKAKLTRWHQLTRYYANKWQYDGSKWAERVWRGAGHANANAVASVPFMITRNMRVQLEHHGFPPHEIAALLPKVAHQLINDKVTYAQFQTQRTQYEAAQVPPQVEQIEEIVQTIHAREMEQPPQQATSLQPVGESSATDTAAANQIAVVPDQKDTSETASEKRL